MMLYAPSSAPGAEGGLGHLGRNLIGSGVTGRGVAGCGEGPGAPGEVVFGGAGCGGRPNAPGEAI